MNAFKKVTIKKENKKDKWVRVKKNFNWLSKLFALENIGLFNNCVKVLSFKYENI